MSSTALHHLSIRVNLFPTVSIVTSATHVQKNSAWAWSVQTSAFITISTEGYNTPDYVGGFIDVMVLVKLHGWADGQTFNLSLFGMFHCVADNFSQWWKRWTPWD